MIGNLYIDGQDIYSLYRVLVSESGYKDLAAFPPLKAVDSNDWAEENGAECDLSAPVLDTRELSIRFAFHGDNDLFLSFVELLSDGAYHDFYFSDLGKTYRLRLVSQADMNQLHPLRVFSLRFADDFPLLGYTYLAPQSGIVPRSGYKLDGKDLSTYGMYVLRGSDAEVCKMPAVKTNLLQNMKSKSGAVYDGRTVVFQTKQVKLNCLMRAETVGGFWRNRDALLFDLIRPGERKLYVGSTGLEYACYYNSCSANNVSFLGKIWFGFSVTLTFTFFDNEGD
jgi:hypothetical protein